MVMIYDLFIYLFFFFYKRWVGFVGLVFRFSFFVISVDVQSKNI